MNSVKIVLRNVHNAAIQANLAQIPVAKDMVDLGGSRVVVTHVVHTPGKANSDATVFAFLKSPVSIEPRDLQTAMHTEPDLQFI